MFTHGGMESGWGTLAPLPTFPATKLGCFYATNYHRGPWAKGPAPAAESGETQSSDPRLPPWLRCLLPGHRVVYQGRAQTVGPRMGVPGSAGLHGSPLLLSCTGRGWPTFPAESDQPLRRPGFFGKLLTFSWLCFWGPI